MVVRWGRCLDLLIGFSTVFDGFRMCIGCCWLVFRWILVRLLMVAGEVLGWLLAVFAFNVFELFFGHYALSSFSSQEKSQCVSGCVFAVFQMVVEWLLGWLLDGFGVVLDGGLAMLDRFFVCM